ncbi:hypothetical protein MMC24_005239 [Lignoscripta atroalba]|nr:hypothetical protein [Lignoscripta atroalba]
MALPAARPVSAPLADTDDLLDRDSISADIDKRESSTSDPAGANKRATPFGKRVAINKPSTPVKASVRSPDRVFAAFQRWRQD